MLNNTGNVLLIWGAGGHGKVVLDIARNTKLFNRVMFLDDNLSKAGLPFCDCPVIGVPSELNQFAGSAFVIAVGDNRTRSLCFNRACGEGLIPIALVHSNATVARSATIGAGTVVMPGSVVNAGAVIGQDCIINTGAVVEHDCRVADHTHISPRVVLGGGVNVGPFAHVGIGAVVLPCATIGEESIVGAGAVVLKEAPGHCTVIGVPAKVSRRA